MRGDIGQLVHEADLRGQHGVGRVLGQFGGAHIHHNHAVAIANEGLIHRPHQLFGTLAVGADDHPVGFHEVRDGCAFLQELGVGNDIELQTRATGSQGFIHRGAHFVGGSHRNRRFGDHHLISRHVLTDGSRHRQHIAQIRRAIFIGRRTHSNQLQQAVSHAFLRIRREPQASGFRIALDDLVQPRLVDRNFAFPEHVDLARIDIDTQHLIARIGKARAGDQAHVTGAKNRNFHA
jgi:hypothetical protein